jgi:hypothetical protein
MIAAHLIGVLMALDTVSRLDYLFTPRARIDGVDHASDVAIVAQAFGAHYLVWGALIAVLSLALLAIGLWLAWRGGANTEAKPALSNNRR